MHVLHHLGVAYMNMIYHALNRRANSPTALMPYPRTYTSGNSKAFNAAFKTELKGHAKIRAVEKHLKQVYVELVAANPNDPEVLAVKAIYEQKKSENAAAIKAYEQVC